MPDPFVHLHVASGYSLRYGASPPDVLVERAAEQEMDTLALTDRDGTYGAVRFAKACLRAGIRPVLGVDLAYAPTLPTPGRHDTSPGNARTPARGGAFRDPRLPRATFLAQGRAGWAALCRLISATRLAGSRDQTVTTPTLIAEHLATGAVTVLLGPGSEVGAAVARGREDLARAALDPWLEVLPGENLVIEVVSHRLPYRDPGPGADDGWGPGTTTHAARMTRFAHTVGVRAVLTNAVRYADRLDAPTVDVLDAARRLVPLDRRHVDRRNAEGFLKSGKQMAEVAEEICRLAGLGDRSARDLVVGTRVLADRCALDPAADLGLGEVHFPEFERADGGHHGSADGMLRARCEGAIGDRYGSAPRQRIWKRLHDELGIIEQLGYASYFLTVADVTDLIREMGIRSAGRGSGAGSLVNYLLGVSGVDPLRHDLLMERFLSPLRRALPDIDLDVESARRLEVYEAILDRYGGERCVCVSMMDTYRVRHAVRDVGAALGMPPGEIDTIAKAFPHIRARDARMALRDLPELRSIGLAEERLDLLFALVERLDGLPRHVAMHPCGVVLSDATLLDRTPVEASFAGFPMSQFDKDDVEDLGLLKLDVLGIRMQSAMAHAVAEVERVDGRRIDLDDEAQVPFDDRATFDLISSARTLGMFQIESPGQRELIGKSGIDTFEEIIADISLFRPGPVKSDMITPYLDAKQGWASPLWLHADLEPILRSTQGVVVFHEHVIEIIATIAGVSYAEADEKRRALGDTEGMAETRVWFHARALERGYDPPIVERIWQVLASFASFGFCKAHAAAFALPTYQSAWLKTHWPAHFLAGVLTHDPGMYPKRLILDDVRQFGIEVLGLDVNASGRDFLVEVVQGIEGVEGGLSDGDATQRRYGLRIALSEVKGITAAEVQRIVAARPYATLTDFWHRAHVSRPIVERLVLAGGFDALYAITPTRRRGRVTRRDLLLQVAGLDQHARALAGASARAGGARRARGRGARGGLVGREGGGTPQRAREVADAAAARNSTDPLERAGAAPVERHVLADSGVWARAAAQSRAAAPAPAVDSVQLSLDLGDEPAEGEVSGLPEMSAEEAMLAELEILGLDASRHVMSSYDAFVEALGVVRSRDLLGCRSQSEILVAGVKVATQTPPIKSGRRVVFLTVDDATGPVDATFFDDVQGPYAATVFGSWLLVVRGVVRRTGHRGISLRATGCWELSELSGVWQQYGIEAVHDRIARSERPRRPGAPGDPGDPAAEPTPRRVLTHTSGFMMSPYADVRPAGPSTRDLSRSAPRHLWHRSPGSSG